MKQPKVIELFAGSRSIGKVAKRMKMQVFSSDIEDFRGIDYQVDILDFDVDEVPFIPDIIWASPPCTGFSVSAIGYHWRNTKKGLKPKTDTAKLGMKLVRKTLEIIAYYQSINPKLIWYIENPRGALRKMDFMQPYTRHTVTYCQYGDSRMKPTDIWTNNLNWKPKEACNNGDPCHESAPRGSNYGTQGMASAYERAIIPQRLCREVLSSCKVNRSKQSTILLSKKRK